MAEETKSIPWMKVFGSMGLSGVWGKEKYYQDKVSIKATNGSQ